MKGAVRMTCFRPGEVSAASVPFRSVSCLRRPLGRVVKFLVGLRIYYWEKVSHA